jgi:hypothetical protein
MKTLAKATSFALLVAATAPFSILALGTLEGCDKFKKGGEADAAPEAAPVATDTATATDSASASAAPTAAPVWHKPAAHVDAGTVKLADGGVAPIPTPIPTPVPSGAPTPSGLVVPTAIPTTLPSNFPKGLPSTLPSGLKLPQPPPTK